MEIADCLGVLRARFGGGRLAAALDVLADLIRERARPPPDVLPRLHRAPRALAGPAGAPRARGPRRRGAIRGGGDGRARAWTPSVREIEQAEPGGVSWTKRTPSAGRTSTSRVKPAWSR